jgi:hypothetical protein
MYALFRVEPTSVFKSSVGEVILAEFSRTTSWYQVLVKLVLFTYLGNDLKHSILMFRV